MSIKDIFAKIIGDDTEHINRHRREMFCKQVGKHTDKHNILFTYVNPMFKEMEYLPEEIQLKICKDVHGIGWVDVLDGIKQYEDGDDNYACYGCVFADNCNSHYYCRYCNKQQCGFHVHMSGCQNCKNNRQKKKPLTNLELRIKEAIRQKKEERIYNTRWTCRMLEKTIKEDKLKMQAAIFEALKTRKV